MKKRFFLIGLILCFSWNLSATSWGVFQHDFNNTGYSPIDSRMDIGELGSLWNYSANASLTNPVAYDINNDGFLEVMVGSENGMLYVFDFSGRQLWNYSTLGGIVAPIGATDLNGDGYGEIAFGSRNREIVLLNYLGGFLWKYRTDQAMVADPVEFLDVTGDGVKEVLMGEYTLSFNGSPVVSDLPKTSSSHAIYEGQFIGGNYPPPSFGDMNNDNGTEFVGWYRTSIAETNRYLFPEGAEINLKPTAGGLPIDLKHLILHNLSGDTIWRYSVPKTTPIVLADLDGDGNLEMVFGSQAGVVYILNNTAYAIWHHRVDGMLDSGLAVADLNRDGKAEIIAASQKGGLYVFGSRADSNGDDIIDFFSATTTTTSSTTTTTSTSSTTTTTSTSSTTTTTSTSSTTTTTQPNKGLLGDSGLIIIVAGVVVIIVGIAVIMVILKLIKKPRKPTLARAGEKD
ncbi:MAG: hypothetical protein B6U72_06085 [Candidatus Altiarchaeales archaeon ex4484_2]|nr:MAG: hypothetical protein B6U72_06085 [Candidatus Altiarchaeales archaeon ex4484_2]